jgi:erythronate-4-phosphate dehydrogenase
MIKIVADEKIPFLKGVLEPYAEVIYVPGAQVNKKIITGADALLIRTRTKCTEELLGGTSVKFIATATIGFDHIDTQYCQKNNIRWTNAPGCNSSSVMQYIAAALLKTSREFRFSLSEKTLAIIGAGNVGSKVEKLASSLGMKVLVNDPPRARQEGDKGFVDFEFAVHKADILTLHVPLTFVGKDKTYHMVNEKIIKKMKKWAWLINSSRGEVAETHSVKKALVSGRLGGAILDVWEHEPDIDHMLMQETFIATPHIAGYSTDGKANGTAIVVNELARFFNLPIKDWYPSDVPLPPNKEISINGKGKSPEAIVREAVEHTYNISEDDLRLRFSPADFEKQRGEYPLRREFTAYRVNLLNSNKQVSKMLKNLGFDCQK